MRRARGTIAAVMVLAACGKEMERSAVPPIVAISPDSIRLAGINCSHDGRRLAYWALSREASNQLELWVSNADFSAAVKLPMTVPSAFFVNPPFFSPDDRMIVAQSAQYAGSGIVLAMAPSTGGAAKQLTHGSGAIPLQWESDNDHVDYFEAVGEGRYVSYVVSISTGRSVRALPNESRSHYAYTSPDRRHVMYLLQDGEKNTIWVADSGGRNARQLTTEGFETIRLIATPWSPDGTRIAYESRRTGTADVWIVGIDGSKPVQLTRDIRNDYDPVWSPDGKWIAFKSDRGRKLDLWVVPSAGGAEQRVTDLPGDKWSPKWSGANRLSIMTDQTRAGFWAVDVATGAERRLTPDSLPPWWAFPPALSADGMLAYPVDPGGNDFDIAVVPTGGGAARPVVRGAGSFGDLRMSPDGSKVAYSSDKAGVGDIWVADVAGGTPRRLTDWPGSEYNPIWSGDGSTLAFLADKDAVGADVWKVPVSGGAPVRVTRSGGFNGLIGIAGLDAVYANVRGKASGKNTLARVRNDGTLQTAWDSSSAYMAGISPNGDSILAVVQVPGGHQESRIQSVRTGRGRRILKQDELAGYWSHDAKFMNYSFNEGGGTSLGWLDLATGATRRLTNTRDLDLSYGSGWTSDDKTIVFVRSHVSTRFQTMDVTKLLSAPVPR